MVKPDSLIRHSGATAMRGVQEEDTQDNAMADPRGIRDDSESVPINREESKQQTNNMKSGIESGTGMQTSQSLIDSIVDNSEDEESRRKDAIKKRKDEKKGLSKEELNALVDITLTETETMTLMFIPGTICTDPNDDSMVPTEDYKKLLSYKVGADSYNNRGSQTLNLTQKPKDIAPERIFMLKDMKVQVNNYEIEEENRKIREDEGARMIRIYEKSIEDIMNDKLQDNKALIDSEELASHISINTQNTTQHGRGMGNRTKTGTTNGNLSKDKSGKVNETTKSLIKGSDTKSGLSDKLSSSSTTQHYTGMGTKTSGLPDTSVPSKMEFVEGDSSYNSSSMLKAIKIIERLLTQTKYHEKHVLYTDYPQVLLPKGTDKKQEDNQNQGAGPGFNFGVIKNKDNEQEEEEEEEEEDDKNEKDPIRLKPLFTFE